MKVWTKAGYVAGLLVVPVVLTGCGFGGGGTSGHAGGHDGGRAGASARARRVFVHEPAGHILRAMSHDMRHVTSFRVTGHMTERGETGGFDLHVTRAGGCTGTVRMDGGTLRIVATDSNFWLKPNHAFFASQQKLAGLEQWVGDRWMEVSQSPELLAFCQVEGWVKHLVTSHGPGKNVVAGDVMVDGHHAVRIVSKDHDASNVAWVAADRPHHLLRIRGGGNVPTTGDLRFSEFNRPVRVTTPDPSDVADLR